MKHLFIIFFLCVFIVSCEDYDIATVVIENNSSYELSNCKVYSYFGDTIVHDSLNFGTVLKNEKLTKTWKTKLPSSDGAFYFKCSQNSKILDKTYSYFSNGGFIEKKYTISITDENITVNSRFTLASCEKNEVEKSLQTSSILNVEGLNVFNSAVERNHSVNCILPTTRCNRAAARFLSTVDFLF